MVLGDTEMKLKFVKTEDFSDMDKAKKTFVFGG